MIGWSARHLVLCLLPVLSVVAVVGPGSAVAAPVPGVTWDVSLAAQPTNLPLTAHQSGEPVDQYVVVLTNTGSVPSSGAITLTDTLPEGVTVGSRIRLFGPWECLVPRGASVVTCSYNAEVPALGQSAVLTIPVAVAKTGVLTNHVTVSGGGALPVAVDRSTDAGAPPPAFGLLDFSSQASDVSGGPDTAASNHPFALTTTLDVPQWEALKRSPEQPVQKPRAMGFDLPVGLIGNPQTVPRCPIVNVLAHACSLSSRVGTLLINYSQGLFVEHGASPIYNVVPERGYPAEFGIYFEGLEKVAFMYASVGPAPEYRIYLSVPDIPAAAIASNVITTFFGDPQRMDGGVNSSVAFFTNPSDCSHEPPVTKVRADSWEEPSIWEEPGSWPSREALALPVTDCDQLQFQPAITVTPKTPLADEPTGYSVDMQVPQSQSTGLEGLATPDVKSATVTLPAGVSLSPAVTDGLAGCPAEGPEGIDLSSSAAGHCPLASQVGTVEAVTPLLESPLEGHLYVALPGCGGAGQAQCTEADAANGTLFGVYLELEGSGVVIKQHGTASVSPVTGQITTSFTNVPQQPFSDLRLTLMDGPRAPLSNPQTCGEALTTSDMTPWSSPQTPDATPSWEFPVTGCEGSPFAPSFLAETTNPAAGAYTNLSTTINRTDRMQDLSAVQAQTPPGLLATIAHVPLCEEPQAAAGTCSPASRIGTATGGVGAGSHPFWVSGPVYLTGPYKGAPFGLSVAIPAKAGPFNLGTVVTRATINIDPTTATATVTSDPLPQIIDGVPLRVQTVNVTLNRSQFIFNPTNCEAHQITATIASAQGATAHVSSPFAAGGCKNLPFNPGFKVTTRAPGSKKKGTSLDVKVSSEPGQANIHSVFVSLPKQLPARLTTLQQACPEATFAANPATCPAGSLVGIATGTTPVLPVPITGPAYLVSHGGAAFPDLKVILQGEGVRVDLTGGTSIAHGITSSTFANIPDAPITSFELKLPEGPHSALTANGNLCAKPLVMPTTIVGQNGRRLVRSTKIAVSGCPKKKPKPKQKRRK